MNSLSGQTDDVPCFHQHLILTAKKKERNVILDIRRSSEKGRFELGGSMEIDNDTFADFRDEFTKPEIYDPLRELTASQREVFFGLDGAMWYLETLRRGKYIRAALWSPDGYTSDTEKDKAAFKKEHGFEAQTCSHLCYFA